MKSRFYIIIIFSIFVITISYVMQLKKGNISVMESQTPDTSLLSTPKNFQGAFIKKMDTSAAPPGFPDIPLNGKKEIENSYVLQYGALNKDQRVVEFTSVKSVKENNDFYKEWAGAHNWKIFNAIERFNESRLVMQKDKTFLNITIQKDLAGGSKVSMSY